MNSEEFVDWLSKQVLHTSNRVVVIGLGGYPFSGKTTISQRLAVRFSASAIIPMESYILPRYAREEHGLDGCSFEAHDVIKLSRDLRRLMIHQPISLKDYSWDIGDYLSTSSEVRLEQGGIIILDGTASGSPRIEALSSLSIFLVPEDSEKWLECASLRDHQERSWSRDQSVVQNQAKALTCSKYQVLSGPPRRRYVHFRIDTATSEKPFKFMYRPLDHE